MRCCRPTYRRCKPNDPFRIWELTKTVLPGAALLMKAYRAGANGSTGPRIDACGSGRWPSLNRSGPASRRPAQPALRVMGAFRG